MHGPFTILKCTTLAAPGLFFRVSGVTPKGIPMGHYVAFDCWTSDAAGGGQITTWMVSSRPCVGDACELPTPDCWVPLTAPELRFGVVSFLK